MLNLKKVAKDLKELLKINSSVHMTTTDETGTHDMTFEELQDWNYEDLVHLLKDLGLEDMYKKYNRYNYDL